MVKPILPDFPPPSFHLKITVFSTFARASIIYEFKFAELALFNEKKDETLPDLTVNRRHFYTRQNMKKNLLLYKGIFFILLFSSCLSTYGEDLIGLPNCHNMTPVFNRYLQTPNFTAQIPASREFFFAPSFSIVQGQTNSLTKYLDGSSEVNVFYDFESYSLQLPIEYGIDDNNAFGLNLQFFCYTGGFLDPVISSYHNLFGFPVNSRDQMPENRLLIDVPTANGFRLYADTPNFCLADPVLWYTRNIFSDHKIHVSSSILAAIPLGLSSGLGGLSFPQIAISVSGLWEPTKTLFVHAKTGLNLPFESLSSTNTNAFMQFQGRTGIIFALAGDVWCGIDVNVLSSPLGNTAVTKDYGAIFNQSSADLFVSLIWRSKKGITKNGLLSFSVEEDPLSHNAPDVGFITTGAFRF